MACSRPVSIGEVLLDWPLKALLGAGSACEELSVELHGHSGWADTELFTEANAKALI